jgi:hypothetical protein
MRLFSSSSETVNCKVASASCSCKGKLKRRRSKFRNWRSIRCMRSNWLNIDEVCSSSLKRSAEALRKRSGRGSWISSQRLTGFRSEQTRKTAWRESSTAWRMSRELCRPGLRSSRGSLNKNVQRRDRWNGRLVKLKFQRAEPGRSLHVSSGWGRKSLRKTHRFQLQTKNTSKFSNHAARPFLEARPLLGPLSLTQTTCTSWRQNLQRSSKCLLRSI